MDKAKAIRQGEELDWDALESHLRTALPYLEGEMQVAQFHGGHANLTYLLTFGEKDLVLRRPPFGKIAPGAHSMAREYRVLSELSKHFPAAPKAYYQTDDESIIGAPFILMERKTGVVVRRNVPESFSEMENAEMRIAEAVVKSQADLHRIDVAAAGLQHLGKPDHFLERQMEGWEKRWNFAKTEENEYVERTFEALKKDIPTPQKTSIIHNDFKPDNCQFQPDNPDLVTAVFDWDMATLGDPLFDFASSLGFWPDGRLSHLNSMPAILVGNWPTKDFLKQKYAEFTGFDFSRFAWYEALAYIKTAIIAQQLYKRYVDGQTADKRMEMFGVVAKGMAELGFGSLEV